MNRFFKNSLLVVTVVLATGAVALPAAASRTVPASAGRPFYGADTCFEDYGGGVRNTCASMREYTIPLVIDSYGNNKSMFVSAYCASASNMVTCYSAGVNDENTSWYTSLPANLPSCGQTDWIPLSSWVPVDGALFIRCDVKPGGHINNVWWSPA